MAPKEPFKVHSLSKHIEETKKGITADAQFNKRPGSSKLPINTKRSSQQAKNTILGSQSDSSDDSSSDSDSDSDDDPSSFMNKLTSKPAPAKPAVRRSKADEIDDSDAERKRIAAEKSKTSIKKTAPAKKTAESDTSSSESESDSESESEAKAKPTKKTNGTTAASKSTTTSASSSSESSSSESESEDESSNGGAKIKQPVQKNASTTNKAPAQAAKNATTSTSTSDTSSESESGSGSESESDSEPAKPTKPTKPVKAAVEPIKAKPAQAANTAKPTKASKATKPSSSSESSSEDDSSSSEAEESESESEAEKTNKTASAKAVTQRVEPSKPQGPRFQAQDFTLRKADGRTIGQDIKQICSTANLQGKQLWYFTTPADVPISVVQNMELPLHQATSDKAILSHQGQDYHMAMDNVMHKGSIQILIPSANGTKYQNVARDVEGVMKIKRVLNLDPHAPGPKLAKRQPRVQPDGLKARFQPIGVHTAAGTNSSANTDVDVEMEDAPAKTSGKKEKKRKTPTDTAEAPAPQTPKKKSKKKHNSSEDEATAAAEQLIEEQMSRTVGSPILGVEADGKATKKTKKSKKDVASTPQNDASDDASKKETPIPLPSIPGFASTSTPQSKSKKVKTPKSAVANSRQSPPASAQSSKKTSK